MTFDITRPPDDADRSIWICENISDTPSRNKRIYIFTKYKSPKTGSSIQSVTRKLSRKTEEAKQILHFLQNTREIQIISSKNSQKEIGLELIPGVQVVRFKNLCISHVGILSSGNFMYTNYYIDFSVQVVTWFSQCIRYLGHVAL